MVGQISLKNTKFLTISSWILLYLLFSCNKHPVDPNPQPKIAQNKPVFKEETEGLRNEPVSLEILTTKRIQEVMNPKNPTDSLFVYNYFATWCPPCVEEIPHFKNEKEKRKGEKIKFVFISVDEKATWNTILPNFVKEKGIALSTKIAPQNLLNPTFFASNFKEIQGGNIPFTKICKNGKCKEYVGGISEDQLKLEIDSFQ